MQAFQNLLNLHILFCPPQDPEAEGSSRAVLSLTLDEEVQLRCAAFVQSEIERFTEDVAVHDNTTDGSGDEGASGSDDPAPKKGIGRGRGKKTTNGTKETGAEALAGTPIASDRVWVLNTDHVLCRQSDHTCAARTGVCFYGRHLDVPAGDPCWGYSPRS